MNLIPLDALSESAMLGESIRDGDLVSPSRCSVRCDVEKLAEDLRRSTTAGYSRSGAPRVYIAACHFPQLVTSSDQTFVVPLNSRFKTGFINPAAVMLHVNSNGVTHKRSCCSDVQSII